MIKELTSRQFEIIQSAGKILSTSGVSGLTIKNLAKEMKFSESALYRHFKGKEDILVSMLEYLADNMDQRYSNIASQDLSSLEKFNLFFINQFEFFQANPHFVVAVFTDGLMEESERINNTILNLMAIKMKHLVPVIADAQEEGVFTNKIKTEEILHITMGAFRLQMFKWRMTKFHFNIVETGAEMLEAILTLIKTEK